MLEKSETCKYDSSIIFAEGRQATIKVKANLFVNDVVKLSLSNITCKKKTQ
jgi:hypothetical protein